MSSTSNADVKLMDFPSTCAADDYEFHLHTLLLSALIGFIMLVSFGIGLLVWRWDKWYSHAAGEAFLFCDRNQSGCIDSEELYMGVLQMYVTVPLKVYPPTRAIVSEVLMHLDLEKTNNLNAEEFAQVMALLSAQMLGRIVITVVFLLSCPVAGGVVWTMIAGWHTGEELVMPAWLRCGVSILVQLHLGPPLLTVTRENAASKKKDSCIASWLLHPH